MTVFILVIDLESTLLKADDAVEILETLIFSEMLSQFRLTSTSTAKLSLKKVDGLEFEEADDSCQNALVDNE